MLYENKENPERNPSEFKCASYTEVDIYIWMRLIGGKINNRIRSKSEKMRSRPKL